jgi:hypothetical protein
MAKKYKARYKTKIFTDNSFLEPDGFSSVVFRNIGSDEVMILNDIPLTIFGEDFAFINREFVVIQEKIPIRFLTTTAPRVIAIMVYYDEF